MTAQPSRRRRCPGGFCGLVLPDDDDDEVGSARDRRRRRHRDRSSLSKRELRLRKGRERDRAVRSLRWVLTEEEHGALEEGGDLVRLRPPGSRDEGGDGEEEEEGCWADGNAVALAWREHRPELARLAFAEFQSSLEGCDHCDGPSSAESVHDGIEIVEPCRDGNEGDVAVCGACFNVYSLLGQARQLLAAQREETASADEDDPGDNQPAEDDAVDDLELMEDVPTNNLKRSSSEMPGSSTWASADGPLSSSASFHGPVAPHQPRKDGDDPKPKGERRRKKRDRKQMEENAKIRILVAESDEVRGAVAEGVGRHSIDLMDLLDLLYMPILCIACDADAHAPIYRTLQVTSKLAKRLLEGRGYRVDCVSNGGDCLKALDDKSYAILLVNENLDGKDAVSIGTWIRQKEASENIPVRMRIVVVVRNVLSINYHTYEEADVDGFLPMPVEGSKLVPSVEKAAAQYLESARLLAEREKAAAAEAAERAASKGAEGQAQKEKNGSTQQSKPLDKPKKKSVTKPAQNSIRGQLSEKLKKKEPIAHESEFRYDENTSFPYAILENCSDEARDESPDGQKRPWCNLIVCQDVFDTYEKFKIFLMPMVARYAGMKVLLWNYPGQAFTSFSEDSNLNNKHHSDCLTKLLEHLKNDEKGKFDVDQRFFILAHGSGAAIATYFAATHRTTSLKGIVLVNGLSHVDSHYASVFHDCRNVFSCSPESRPDLPVYFYARFLFSPSYLSKTSSSLALNVYTAVHNPITLEGRKRLCQGVLNHVDTRPMLKDIGSPIVSIHGENATLVRAMHSSEFLTGRRSCATIPQALRGGNRTAIVMIKGGHELFQEKKYHISLLVEQILTGFHDNVRVPLNPADDANPLKDMALLKDLESSEADTFRQPTKKFEDKFLDQVVQDGRDGQSPWDRYQDEIMTGHQSNLQNRSPSQSNIMQKEKQKAGEGKKELDPNEYPEVKEYMAWRIKRHKKRLAALERSARIIQCALRCFMAKTMINRLKKQQAATLIQSRVRGIFGRHIYEMKKKELWAALFVQRAIRGHNGRCVSYNKRMERRAQMNLARMMRGVAARRRFREVLRRREYSATKIQSIWRMKAAIILKYYHRRRRDASTMVQKTFRGLRGRKTAALERDKYVFSRSQNSGIELGRQMLAEHKLHATKLQSEIALLNQAKDKMEKQIEFHLTEISNFERNVYELEKKMHRLSKAERLSFGVLASTQENEVREEKRRMDEEFSETLVKISDRKAKLEKLEQTFEQLLRDRQEKFGLLKNLEGKLAVLLDAQDSALEGIRRKQEERIDSIVSANTVPCSDSRPTPTPISSHDRPPTQRTSNRQPIRNDAANNQYYTGPSEKDKVQAAQLIDSTETMMKFGFMSMSLTYFSSLNMMKAMQRVAVNDTLNHADGAQHPNSGANSMMPSRNFDSNASVRVESWSVNDVSRWLTSISLSQYQSSFKEGAVDGTFLCELTDDDLRNTLGVEHRLHRKKILFSIRCLKNYAEGRCAQSTANAHNIQPLHHTVGGKSTIASMSPNSTIYEDGSTTEAPRDMSYSNHERRNEYTVGSPAKSNSVLDMMTPTRTEKPSVTLNFDQLRAWVRHQKHENIREALDHIADSPFHSKHIRIQFIEEIGTAYTDQYDRDPFNLNRVDEHGNTLMHIAAQTGNIRIGKLLLRKGVNPNHQNKQGQTPGHFAVAYHFFKFASWMFDEKGGGADDLLTNMYGLGPYDGLD
ncbi:hypothetical protein ACHAWF_019034 [Thalassiosira exigua]